MENAFEFTIVIPVYNEEENLERLSLELNKFLSRFNRKTKVLFVNDGSTDRSQEMIEAVCRGKVEFGFIQFAENCGVSAAMKAGFDNVDTPFIGYLDSDLQTTPADFHMLFKYADEYDLVNGYRKDRKDSFVKNTSSTIANAIRRAFTQDGMDDTACPLKIIKADYAQNIPMFKGLHRFLPAMVLLQKGKVCQVPVKHFPRQAGSSKFGFWNRLVGPLTDCFAFLWMKKKYIRYTVIKRG